MCPGCDICLAVCPGCVRSSNLPKYKISAGKQKQNKIAIASPKGGFAPQSAPDAHGALGRAGFFDYPQRSIFPLRDRSGPVKQALVSKMVFRRVDFGPQQLLPPHRIALMSSRRLLPSPWYDLGLGFPGFLAGDGGKVLTTCRVMGAGLTALSPSFA